MLTELQKQLEETLEGTLFQPVGDAAVELASTPPLTVKVQLQSLEPLDAQTASVLSSELSKRLSTPVQLHGEVRLTGPGYQSSLEVPKSHHALVLQDRQNLAQLAKLVGERPDLQLHITYPLASGGADGTAWPPLLHEIQRVLSENRLKPSQWIVQPTGGHRPGPAESTPSSSGAKNGFTAPAPKSAAAGVRYEFQTFQDF
ncbi:MAG: hypothetical protein ACRD2O_07060 [Terriglobia bacterium]